MTYEKLLSALASKRNGSFFSCAWERQLKTKKGVNSNITKQVTATVRKGIDRRNMAKFKNGLEVYRNSPLPWGQWKRGQEGLIIEYTNKKGVEKNYVRFYTTVNKPKIQYFVDGREVPKECIMNLVQKSELTHENIVDCFVVDVHNIKYIK